MHSEIKIWKKWELLLCKRIILSSQWTEQRLDFTLLCQILIVLLPLNTYCNTLDF